MITKQLKFVLLKGILSGVTVLSLLGGASYAYAADITFSDDTNVTIGSDTYVIAAGSTATAPLINTATNLTVTIPASSSFRLDSASGYKLANDASVSSTCNSGRSSISLIGTGQTVVITPDTTQVVCTGPGGGGGGGGGGGTPTVTPPPVVVTPTTPSPTVAPQQLAGLLEQLKSLVAILEARGVTISPQVKMLLNSIVAPATRGNFTSDLKVGSKGEEVSALQNWLIKKGYTLPSGATGLFGAQTKAAVAAYQKANGISPASGMFGPKTRAYVEAHP